MIKVGIYGSTGRVGKLLIENLKDDKEAKVSIVHVITESKVPPMDGIEITSDVDLLLEKSDIVIDFTIASGTGTLLEAAIDNPTPLVIGTTGLNEHQLNLLEEASKQMPILYATNMSLGVAVMNRLVELASKSLSDFDIEIVEQHHRHKKDAPSGTAITFGEYAAKGRELNLDDVRVSGRNGLIGERSQDEIAIMALRGGDIVGRHTVGFYNDGEFVEINHTATSRDTFAKGAIKATKWIINQPNGQYHISDCLGLN